MGRCVILHLYETDLPGQAPASPRGSRRPISNHRRRPPTNRNSEPNSLKFFRIWADSPRAPANRQIRDISLVARAEPRYQPNGAGIARSVCSISRDGLEQLACVLDYSSGSIVTVRPRD